MHSEDGRELFRLITRLYFGMGAGGIILLGGAAPWILRLVAGPDYYSGFVVIGALAWQSLFYGAYLIVTPGLWKSKKTYLSTGLLIVSAAVNAGLSWLLVPRLGLLGAALATALAFSFWIALSICVSENLWRVGFRLRTLAFQIGLGVVGLWIVTQVHLTTEDVWPGFLIAVPIAILSGITGLPLRDWRVVGMALQRRLVEVAVESQS